MSLGIKCHVMLSHYNRNTSAITVSHKSPTLTVPVLGFIGKPMTCCLSEPDHAHKCAVVLFQVIVFISPHM